MASGDQSDATGYEVAACAYVGASNLDPEVLSDPVALLAASEPFRSAIDADRAVDREEKVRILAARAQQLSTELADTRQKLLTARRATREALQRGDDMRTDRDEARQQARADHDRSRELVARSIQERDAAIEQLLELVNAIGGHIPARYEASDVDPVTIIADWVADIASDDMALVRKARGEGEWADDDE